MRSRTAFNLAWKLLLAIALVAPPVMAVAPPSHEADAAPTAGPMPCHGDPAPTVQAQAPCDDGCCPAPDCDPGSCRLMATFDLAPGFEPWRPVRIRTTPESPVAPLASEPRLPALRPPIA